MTLLKKCTDAYNKINTNYFFILLALIILTLITLLKFPDFLNTRLMQDRWFPCLEFLENGELYNGNAYCFHGPIMFYTLYLIYAFFKDNMYLALSWIGIFLNVIILFIARLMIEKETGKKAFFSLIMIYSVTVYFPYLSTIYGILLSTVFFMMGMYLLLYTPLKHKESIAALLFFLSVFSTIMTMLAVLFVIAWYLFQNMKRVMNKESVIFLIKKGGVMICTFAVPLIVLSIIHPLMLKYILIHGTYDPMNLQAMLVYILKAFDIFHAGNGYAFVFVAMISISFLLFFLKKNGISFCISFGWALTTLLWLRSAAINPENVAEIGMRYYHATFYVLFIIAVYITVSTLSKKWQMTLSVLLMLLTIPFFIHMYYEVQHAKAAHIAERSLTLLSGIPGEFIIENVPNKIVLQKILPSVAVENKNWTLLYQDNFDFDIASERLIQRKVAWKPMWDEVLKEREELKENVTREIIVQKYDVLILHPYGYELILNDTINNNPEIQNMTYYPIAVPYFIDGNGYPNAGNEIVIIFNDPYLYLYYSASIQEFYVRHFQEFCAISPEIAQRIKKTLSDNHIIRNRALIKNKKTFPELACKQEGWFSYAMREKFKINWSN